jgi:hypothetical protein
VDEWEGRRRIEARGQVEGRRPGRHMRGGRRLDAVSYMTYRSLMCGPHDLRAHTSVTGKSGDVRY